MTFRIWTLLIFTSIVSFSMGGEFGETIQLFSQFAVDGGATTFFVIHNPGEETIVVRLQMRRSDGSLLVNEEVTLEPGTTTTIEKGGGPGELTVGWARLSSSAPFTATEFFRITVGTQELPRVGVLPSSLSARSQLFGFVEAGVLSTGIAAANPSATESAQVTIRLIDGDGNVVATKVE